MKWIQKFKKKFLCIGIFSLILIIKDILIKVFFPNTNQSTFTLYLFLDFLLLLAFISLAVWCEHREKKEPQNNLEKKSSEENIENHSTDILNASSHIQASNLYYGHISIMEMDWKAKRLHPLNCSMAHLEIYEDIDNIPTSLIERGFLHQDSISAFKSFLQQMESGEKNGDCILQLKTAANTFETFHLQYHMMYDNRGIPIKTLVFLEDFINYKKELSLTQNHPLSSNNITCYCNINLTQDKIVEFNGYRMNSPNDALLSLHQIKYSEIYKSVVQNFVWGEDLDVLLSYTNLDFLLHHHEKGQQWMQVNHRIKNKNGSFTWMITTLHFMNDSFSKDKFVFIYHQNISEQKIPAFQSKAKDYFQKFLVASTIGYCDANITQNYIETYNGEWKNLVDSLQLKKDIGDYDRFLVETVNLHIPDEYMQMYYSTLSRDNLLNAFTRGETELRFEHMWKQKDKTPFWVMVSIYLFRDDITQDIRGLICMKDIHEEKTAQLELQNKAERDSLSQLYNRCAFESRVEALLEKEPYEQHALFVIDVDNFKTINDTFGHQYGDQILQEISEIINNTFRKDDIKGRIGGDEFTVCLQNVVSMQAVIKKAKQLSKALYLKRRKNHLEYVISVSIGVALYPQHGNNYFTLFEKADNALYVTKQNGKNQVSVFQYEDNTPEWKDDYSLPNNETYREWILDETDDLMYVADLETYELLYMNRACQTFYLGKINANYIGQKCYRMLYGKEKPCEFCSNFYLIQNNFYVWEQYQPETDQYFLMKDRLIQWNNRMARIEFGIDITNTVKEKKCLQNKIDFYENILKGTSPFQNYTLLENKVYLIADNILDYYQADSIHILAMKEKHENLSPVFNHENSSNAGKNFYEKTNWSDLSSHFTHEKSHFMYNQPDTILHQNGILSTQITPVFINNTVIGWVIVVNPKIQETDFSMTEAFSDYIACEIILKNEKTA